MPNLGITIQETDNHYTPSAAPAPTAVTGFVLRLPDAAVAKEPVTVTSWRAFKGAFLGAAPAADSPQAEDAEVVRGFFANGGAEAVVVGLDTSSTSGGQQSDPLLDALADALSALERVRVQLLVVPAATTGAALQRVLEHCAAQGDRFFIGQPPDGVQAKQLQGDDTALGLAGAADAARRYGALYHPLVTVLSEAGTPHVISPAGHVAGVYARTDRGRGVWKAPAGLQAGLAGVSAVTETFTDREHSNMVEAGRVNAVRPLPGYGVVIDSARTLSADPAWWYVNVRRLMNYLKSSLLEGLQWARYEPNTEALWGKVRYQSVEPLLMGLWRQGAFGPGAPEQCFRVQVDAENNPPEAVERGELRVEVTFYPSRPAESIVIEIGQQRSGATASEA